MPDDKIPSNFNGGVPSGSQLFAAPTLGMPLPPPPDDYESPGASLQITMQDGTTVQPTVGTTNMGQPVMVVPQEPPKDFQALAETVVYEQLTKHGAADGVIVTTAMIDGSDGTGKAVLTTRKDIMKRRWEIPIKIKGGNASVSKAIDLDSGEVVDVAHVFDPPTDKTIKERFKKVYDLHPALFKGKPNDKRIKAVLIRFPSLTQEQARELLQWQHDENKGMLFGAVDKFKDKVDVKSVAMITAVVAGAAITLFLWKRRTDKEI